ncbi:hypothetical protein [Mesorhizobium sp. M1378]|uniref:hypothetical protein n=1 Tax=Mesorhizobium sp. M1378 TaxID=2957092 RepID=UPI00333537D0
MTAVNILKTTDAVHILTDGLASSLFAGQVGLKCFPIPHLNAAIATRGAGALLHTLSTALIIQSQDFADLVSALGVEPQQVVLGLSEATDGRFGL